MGVIVTTENYTVNTGHQETVFEYIDGEELPALTECNKSFTISYSLKDNEWVGLHSYLPSFYLRCQDNFYSWKVGSSILWKHNKQYSYCKFYGTQYPYIIEYILLSPNKEEVIWENIDLLTYAKKFNEELQNFVEERFVTFNKLIAYNTRQCTGLVNLIPKDTIDDEANYMLQQVEDTPGEVKLDKNGHLWSLNDLRDVVIDYTKPLFKKDNLSLSSQYYIDKVLNEAVIDFEKNWIELESFKDKYLILRFIFDNFENVKLIADFSEEKKTPISS